MANPVLVNVPGGAWKMVAENKQNGYVNIQGPHQERPKVFFAFVDTGETGPTVDPPAAASMGIALEGRVLPINSTTKLDTYLFPVGETVTGAIDVVVAAT